MELKDRGPELRSWVDSWKARHALEGDDSRYAEGWAGGVEYCGNELEKLLDKCGVPQLEPESEG